MTVKRKGSKFVLLSRTGKVLGTHDTKAKAFKQESAIKHAKARRR
jgi:hypothetical protein